MLTMPKKNIVIHENRNLIVQMRESGMYNREIAELFNVSPSAIDKLLGKTGQRKRKEDIKTRFFRHVFITENCWNWTAKKCRFGYGHFYVDNRTILAHRFSWELHNGQIPAGMNVCHKCDNPSCVNPDHLFLGTDQENVDDMINKKRSKLNGRPKTLSIEQILEIRKLYDGDGISQNKIAEIFKVSQKTISDIVRKVKAYKEKS